MSRIRSYRKAFQVERRQARRHAIARKLAFLASA
jgi:hypothetical protein